MNVILDPGSFRVSDYRKSMSWRVKCAALMAHFRTVVKCQVYGAQIDIELYELPLEHIEFDHYPALCDRPFDTDAQDFIPPQNDPEFIIPREQSAHLEKTTGRKVGAAKTVTTLGSDLGNRRKTADIRAREAYHRAALASKAGRNDEAKEILAQARLKKKHTRPKQKIAQRATPWPKRKVRA